MIYLLMAVHVCLVIGIMFWFFARVDARARKEERERIWWIVRSEYDEACEGIKIFIQDKDMRSYCTGKKIGAKQICNKIIGVEEDEELTTYTKSQMV